MLSDHWVGVVCVWRQWLSFLKSKTMHFFDSEALFVRTWNWVVIINQVVTRYLIDFGFFWRPSRALIMLSWKAALSKWLPNRIKLVYNTHSGFITAVSNNFSSLWKLSLNRCQKAGSPNWTKYATANHQIIVSHHHWPPPEFDWRLMGLFWRGCGRQISKHLYRTQCKALRASSDSHVASNHKCWTTGLLLRF